MRPYNKAPTAFAKKKPLVMAVSQNCELLEFLLSQNPSKSRNETKSLLRDKKVFIEDQAVSQFNHPLLAGQSVEIRWETPVEEKKLRGLKIIFEDQYLIVVNKEAGVLSIATEKQKENTAYSILSQHVKQEDPSNRIFVVHRLDKDTSGIMMYAKSQEIQKKIQAEWNENILERTYLAVIAGKVTPPSGVVTSYLVESKALIVYSSQNAEMGQKAVTHYETFKKSKHFCLLKVNLETGRKNQIRVHMQDLGHPIVGDQKYGSTSNPIKRLGLHAWVLAFKHPISLKTMRFETEIPKIFLGLF
jgi:23S rRNA pseudouridine1911/1915/1917 synthase